MINYMDFKNEKDYEKLKEISQIIKNGEIVVFPTETVYAIGTNGLDESAISKLYKVKERPLNKPITLLISNMSMLEKVTKNITDIEYKLIEKFFPGPLTIILEKSDIVPKSLTNNGNTVGIRMPKNDIALKLIEYSGVPIAAPSANISGNPSGIDIKKISEEFGEKVDYYIDEGKSEIGISSTIIKVIDNIPYILREGSIRKEEIEELLNKKVIIG